EKTITKHGLELKEQQGDQRIYRRKDELPDPSKSHRSEVNRLKKQFRVRVEPELQQRVDDAAKAEGMTRQDWVERALRRALGEPE
ncbi:MAG: toxin-antitoxin system HicB family antitoxin, partial [Caulobacterales bacterium]|uniref:toxin-antitoxin system HicB family antitoxin n=1 Tax=Glycocaulis sp. TaxID=1969725 RepID=UPI003FA15D90